MTPDWIARQCNERERPEGRPALFQRWEHLLFLHWAVEAPLLQATLPEGLTIDTFEGQAWLAVVPFRMSGVRPRGLPALPWLSSFLELNVRTYVRDSAGRPGVWFYSLDCNQALAVEVARTVYGLDYFHAHMRMTPAGDGWAFESWRHDRRTPCSHRERAVFHHRPAGEAGEVAVGSLEFFLIERYRLFSRDRHGRLRSGRVWHPPYQIAPAIVDRWDAGVLAADGLPVPPGKADHVCCVGGVDVEVHALEPPR